MSEGWRVPFTSRVMVDENAVFEIIDQMRLHIPDQLRQAERITRDADRMIARAKEEAERIKAQARQEAEGALSQQEQVIAAQARADQIIAEAQREGQALRQDATRYAAEVLTEMERTLSEQLRLVRNGLKRLSSENNPAGEGDGQSPSLS